MNILELLDQEIKNKNWSLEEKQRHLYLRCCQLFSYDERYYFYGQLSDKNKRIYDTRNRDIDLENVEDNRVICTSHSEKVLKPVFKELLNTECEIEGDFHQYITFYDNFKRMKADSTNRSDLTRVKMNLSTYGYHPTTPYSDFDLELKERDKNIHYIEREYSDYLFETRAKILYPRFIQDSSKEVFKDSDDFLLYQLKAVKDLFENYNFSNFSDNEFCISYLIKKILDDNQEKVEEPIKLFQIDDLEKWNLVTLYPINLQDDRIYFVLEQNQSSFQFHETTREEARQYKKHFYGKDRNLIY